MNLLEYCLIPDWPAPANVKALQTTRLGGISVAPYDSLNLGGHVGDVPLAVAHNHMLLNHLLPSEPVWLEQAHGTAVANADDASCGCDTLLPTSAVCGSSRMVVPPAPDGSTAPCRGDRPQACPEPGRKADACIARHRAAVCVVMTADCLPVLLCDKQGSVVGAAHAGWKGLAAGVIESTVQAMNVVPQNLMAWLGPAIGQDAFEVGEEVRAAFVTAHPQAASAFTPSPLRGEGGGEGGGEGEKWLADIYALARLRLNALGITQIYGGNYCTHRESEKFFSYRRDGITGRMGTFIWLE